MRKMTEDEKRVAVTLFGSEDADREGKDRLTIRFNPETLTFYKPFGYRRTKLKGMTLLRYAESTALTPTGGRYTARRLKVRSKDGRLWWGTLKTGTEVVRLRLADSETGSESTSEE